MKHQADTMREVLVSLRPAAAPGGVDEFQKMDDGVPDFSKHDAESRGDCGWRPAAMFEKGLAFGAKNNGWAGRWRRRTDDSAQCTERSSRQPGNRRGAQSLRARYGAGREPTADGPGRPADRAGRTSASATAQATCGGAGARRGSRPKRGGSRDGISDHPGQARIAAGTCFQYRLAAHSKRQVRDRWKQCSRPRLLSF